MNESSAAPRIRLTPSALILGLSLIVATLIAGGVVMQTKLSNKSIHVKGFAEKRIVSDFAIWRTQVTVRGPQLAAAYDDMARAMQRVVAFVEQKGVKPPAMDLSSISTEIRYKRTDKGYDTGDIDAYILQQTLTLRTVDIPLVQSLSREVTSLIKEGLELRSFDPEYYYTKLEDLKVEMLGQATKDARRRAETIAASGRVRLDNLRSAQQGVFQVTPIYSTEVSSEGLLDTSSIDKTIKAVVDAEFGLK